MKQNRTVWWVALAVILALGAWWFFGKKTPEVKVEPVKTSHIATLKVAAGAHANQASFDGVVESVRQSVIAAQVAGNIVEIRVRAGDRVSVGQLLLRIDGMAAEQAAAAARNEYARQEALYRKNYISKAAL